MVPPKKSSPRSPPPPPTHHHKHLRHHPRHKHHHPSPSPPLCRPPALAGCLRSVAPPPAKVVPETSKDPWDGLGTFFDQSEISFHFIWQVFSSFHSIWQVREPARSNGSLRNAHQIYPPMGESGDGGLVVALLVMADGRPPIPKSAPRSLSLSLSPSRDQRFLQNLFASEEVSWA